MFFKLLVLLSDPAFACDPKALTKTLNAAKGEAVPAAYVELAQCDAKAGKAQATAAFGKVKTTGATPEMMGAAARVGAHDAVRTYVQARPGEERQTLLAVMADACSKEPDLGAFFPAAAKAMTTKFWDEAWYTPLASCRGGGTPELLASYLGTPEKNRDRFFAVMDIYAENQGAAAIPLLAGQLAAIDDLAEVDRVIAAIQAAAQTGGDPGRLAAIDAFVQNAANVPVEALPKLRVALQSLGAASQADALAGLYYADRKQGDGQLHYGVVAVETARCKKGKTAIRAHLGEAVEGGNKWPDQVKNSLSSQVRAHWSFTLAQECKGGGSVDVLVSEEPLDGPSLALWQQAQVAQARQQPADTFEEVTEPTKLKLQ